MRDLDNPPSTKLAERPLLVGVSGKRRHGKGAIAERLVEKHGFVRVGFKDAIVEAALALNPIVGLRMTGRPPQLATGWVRFADVLRDHGYEGAKDHPIFGDEFVRVLQDCGKGIREHNPDFWVEVAGEKIIAALRNGQSVVVDDTRFPNEAMQIRGMGGSLWRVNRTPAPPVPEELAKHISETALDDWEDWNHVITNGSTLTALHQRVDGIVRALP